MAMKRKSRLRALFLTLSLSLGSSAGQNDTYVSKVTVNEPEIFCTCSKSFAGSGSGKC